LHQGGHKGYAKHSHGSAHYGAKPGGALMKVTFRQIAIIGLCLVLSACSLPRGAGFRSEVLAARNINGDAVADFAVFSVTRDSLPLINSWPTYGAKSYSWIKHVDQPASMIISPGDTLQISIWDAEENSLLTGPAQRVAQLQGVEVGADGRIFLPFVGNMKVSGMSPATARARRRAPSRSPVRPAAHPIRRPTTRDPAAGNICVSSSTRPSFMPRFPVSPVARAARPGRSQIHGRAVAAASVRCSTPS